MIFQFLKDRACPTCGSAVVMEACRSRHTNGQGFEELEYACGRKIGWSPNFGRIIIHQECPQETEEKRRRENRGKAIVSLREFIDKMDVDGEWKDRVRRWLP